MESKVKLLNHLVASKKIVDQVIARRHPPGDNFVEIFVLLSPNLEARREHAPRLFAEFLSKFQVQSQKQQQE